MSSKYIPWIDALKGFGIFCVTLGHLSPWYPLETHIYSFHMCLFFFISGYLFTPPHPNSQTESLLIFINKKFKSILIPFLVWDFWASFAAIVLGAGKKDTISKFFTLNGEICWNAPIWFLLVLFIAESLYAIIIKFYKSKKANLIVLMASIVLFILFGGYNSLPLKLNLVPLALFFYGLGNTFHRLYNGHPTAKTPINVIVILGIISVLFGVILNIRISYTGASFGNIYYCIIAAISGTLFYVLLFKNWQQLGNNKILCLLGKNSLIIMATQYWFFRFFDIISQKKFDKSVWHARSTLKATIVTIITISLIITGVFIFKMVFKDNKKVLLLAKYFGIR